MTKKQLKKEIQDTQTKLMELLQVYENMPDELVLKDKSKPFSKWTMTEMNNLIQVDEDAFNWFNDENNKNMNKSILDYNANKPKRLQVPVVEE